MIHPGRSWLRRGLGWLLLWQTLLRLWRKFSRQPRPGWLEWEPGRLLRACLWPPATLVSHLGIRPGMRLVEIEAGAGGLTLALGQAVGPEGAVIATDHRPAVVANLGLTALEHGLAHVTVSPLPVGSLPPAASGSDGVILTAAFNSLPDKQAFVLEVYRALRPGGMLAISELITDPDYCLASTVVTYLVLAGFVIERETDSLTGYTVIGRKPA